MTATALNSYPVEPTFPVKLPPLVRIQDTWEETWISIRDLTERNRWQVRIEDENLIFDFAELPEVHRLVCKRWVVDMIENLAIQSAFAYYRAFLVLPQQTRISLLNILIRDHPSVLQRFWIVDLLPEARNATCVAVRCLVRMFCERAFGAWSQVHLDMVSALPAHSIDKYAVIKQGDPNSRPWRLRREAKPLPA